MTHFEHEDEMPRQSRARFVLLGVGLLGEMLMGGLIFGWNALSVVLKAEGVYSGGCDTETSDNCSSQDSRLAVVWTAGVFAVNFGLAIAGTAIDTVGPRLVGSIGAAMASAGLVIVGFGVNSTSVLPAGAFLVGLGGLGYHMSQFHVAQLFPKNRGFVSSLYVGFFIGSGVTFEVIRAIYAALVTDDVPGHSPYRAILVTHACLCLPWAVLMLWMSPRHALKTGQTYRFEPSRFKFVVSPPTQAPEASQDCTDDLSTSPCTGNSSSKPEEDETKDWGLPAGGAGTHGPNTPPQVQGSAYAANENCSSDPKDPCITVPNACATSGAPGHDRSKPHEGDGEVRPCPQPASTESSKHMAQKHGLQLRERWMRLATKPLRQQLITPECVSLGLFFICNVYVLQLYLGTARIQLEEMGDDSGVYLRILSLIVPGVFVLAPFSGYILDRLGFGIVLLVINCLSLAAAVFQSIQVLQLQVVTFCMWASARFLLYSSFFTIVGCLFSYQSFGRIIALISAISGLLGLTQLPLTDFAIDTLDKNFLSWHIAEMVVVSLLFVPAILMYRWERIG